jgi:transcriptional regulator with XRE-family HTH domain
MKSTHPAQPTFGAHLFDLRSRSGKSQRELAVEAGVSKSYLCDLENERRTPPPAHTANALALAVNASTKERAELVDLAHRGRQQVNIRVSKTAANELASLLRWLARSGPTLSIERIARIRADLEKTM